tara:strand:- start:380 stop:556 length:177 start_codon:yes stop_codon:yes gene_type:complete
MELPKLYKERILSITDSISHASQTSNGHLPDKIACILTNIELLKLEVKKLKELNNPKT